MGTWRGVGILPRGAKSGTYRLYSLSCVTTAKMTVSYFSTAPTFTQSGPGDSQVPAFEMFSSTPFANATVTRDTAADTLRVTAVVVGRSSSPLTTCTLVVTREATTFSGPVDSVPLHYTLASSDDDDQPNTSELLSDSADSITTITVSGNLPATAPHGAYRALYISCADALGNVNDYVQLDYVITLPPVFEITGGSSPVLPTIVGAIVDPRTADLARGLAVQIVVQLDNISNATVPIQGCVATFTLDANGDGLTMLVASGTAQYPRGSNTGLAVEVRVQLPPTTRSVPWRLEDVICWDDNGAVLDRFEGLDTHAVAHNGTLDLLAPQLTVAGAEIKSAAAAGLASNLPSSVIDVVVLTLDVLDDVSGIDRCEGELRAVSVATGRTLLWLPTQSPRVEPWSTSATVTLVFPIVAKDLLDAVAEDGASGAGVTLKLSAIRCFDNDGRFATELEVGELAYSVLPPAPPPPDESEIKYREKLLARSSDTVNPTLGLPSCSIRNIVDTTPPQIFSLQTPVLETYATQGANYVRLLVRAMDDATGVARCTIYIKEDLGGVFTTESWPLRPWPSENVTHGLRDLHVFIAERTYVKHSPSIFLELVNVSCTDGAGNVGASPLSELGRNIRPSPGLRTTKMVNNPARGPRIGPGATNLAERVLPAVVARAALETTTADTSVSNVVVNATVMLQRNPVLEALDVSCVVELRPPAAAVIEGVGAGVTRPTARTIVLATVEATAGDEEYYMLHLQGLLPAHSAPGLWLVHAVECRAGEGEFADRHGMNTRVEDVVELQRLFNGPVLPGVFQTNGDNVDVWPPLVFAVPQLTVVGGSLQAEVEATVKVALEISDAGMGLGHCEVYFAQLAEDGGCQEEEGGIVTTTAVFNADQRAKDGQLWNLEVLAPVMFSVNGRWRLYGLRCVDLAGNAATYSRSSWDSAPDDLTVRPSRGPPGSGGGGGGVAVAAAAAIAAILLLVIVVLAIRKRRRSPSVRHKTTTLGRAEGRATGGGFGAPAGLTENPLMAYSSDVRQVRAQSVSQRFRAASQYSQEGTMELEALRWGWRSGRVG